MLDYITIIEGIRDDTKMIWYVCVYVMYRVWLHQINRVHTHHYTHTYLLSTNRMVNSRRRIKNTSKNLILKDNWWYPQVKVHDIMISIIHWRSSQTMLPTETCMITINRYSINCTLPDIKAGGRRLVIRAASSTFCRCSINDVGCPDG
jgi:hypothetical protein